MNKRIFVKPAAAALKVRKPVGGHLAEGGEWQNDDAYWCRRLADGDVVEATGPREEQEAAASSSTADAPAAGRLAKK